MRMLGGHSYAAYLSLQPFISTLRSWTPTTMNAQPNPYLRPAQGYYGQPGPSSASPLRFYQAPHATHESSFYSQPGLQGNVASGGGAQGHTEGFGGNIQQQGSWWHAFGTGGFEGEPPLLEGRRVTRLALSIFLVRSHVLQIDYMNRTGHQLFPYPRQVAHRAQPATDN
jgi:hypothetical protein